MLDFIMKCLKDFLGICVLNKIVDLQFQYINKVMYKKLSKIMKNKMVVKFE